MKIAIVMMCDVAIGNEDWCDVAIGNEDCNIFWEANRRRPFTAYYTHYRTPIRAIATENHFH